MVFVDECEGFRGKVEEEQEKVVPDKFNSFESEFVGLDHLEDEGLVIWGWILNFFAQIGNVLPLDEVEFQTFFQEFIGHVPVFDEFWSLEDLDEQGLILGGVLEVVVVGLQNVVHNWGKVLKEFGWFNFFNAVIENVPESVLDDVTGVVCENCVYFEGH